MANSARIYRPAMTSMQSGRGKTREWVLEFDGDIHREIEPLMGWTAVNDTTGQVQLHFPDRDAAIDFAKRNGMEFTVDEPREPKRLVKSYAANFSANRKRPWTH